MEHRAGPAAGGACSIEQLDGADGSAQVEQEPRRTALREMALALFGDFAGFFAVLASDCKWQRPQPPLRDLVAALEAVSVGALGQPAQRLFDLVKRLRLHLNESEFDVVLNVGFG